MRFALVLTLVFCLGAAVLVTDRHAESMLLRSDPDALPHASALTTVALRRGQPLFEAHCAACHGSGAGDPAKGIPDLTDGAWLYGTGRVIEIEQIIEFGIRSRNARAFNLAVMPAFARPRPSPTDEKIQPLSPNDIGDVVELLYRQQGRDADPAAAGRGAVVYQGRGGCYDCHASDLKGDSAIGAPNLTDRITLYGDGSREALFRSIAYGRQGVCPAWLKQLSPAAILEIALYTHSLSRVDHAPS